MVCTHWCIYCYNHVTESETTVAREIEIHSHIWLIDIFRRLMLVEMDYCLEFLCWWFETSALWVWGGGGAGLFLQLVYISLQIALLCFQIRLCVTSKHIIQSNYQLLSYMEAKYATRCYSLICISGQYYYV